MAKKIEGFGEGGLEKIKKGKNRGGERGEGRPEGRKAKSPRPSDKIGWSFNDPRFSTVKQEVSHNKVEVPAGREMPETEPHDIGRTGTVGNRPPQVATPDTRAGNTMQGALIDAVKERKLDEEPGYSGDNPRTAGEVKGDLSRMGIIDEKLKKKVAAPETKKRIDKDEELRNLFHLYLQVPFERIDNYREYPADIRMQIDEVIGLLRSAKVSDKELGQIKLLAKQELQKSFKEKDLPEKEDGRAEPKSPFEESDAEKLVKAALGEAVFEKEDVAPAFELSQEVQAQLNKFYEDEVGYRRNLKPGQISLNFQERTNELKNKVYDYLIAQGKTESEAQKLANAEVVGILRRVFQELKSGAAMEVKKEVESKTEGKGISDELMDAALELRRLTTRKREGGNGEEQARVLERQIIKAQKKLEALGCDEDVIRRLEEKGPVDKTAVKKILRRGMKVKSTPEVSPLAPPTGEPAPIEGGASPEKNPNLEEIRSSLYEAELAYLREGDEVEREKSEELRKQILDYFIAQGKSPEEVGALATIEVRNVRDRAIEALKTEEVLPQAETPELTEGQINELKESIRADWEEKLKAPEYSGFSADTKKAMLEDLTKETLQEVLDIQRLERESRSRA